MKDSSEWPIRMAHRNSPSELRKTKNQNQNKEQKLRTKIKKKSKVLKFPCSKISEIYMFQNFHVPNKTMNQNQEPNERFIRMAHQNSPSELSNTKNQNQNQEQNHEPKPRTK